MSGTFFARTTTEESCGSFEVKLRRKWLVEPTLEARMLAFALHDASLQAWKEP
jgi:hypothetical protein